MDAQKPSWADELRNATSIFVKILTPLNVDEPALQCAVLHELVSCMQKAMCAHEGMICQFLEDDKGIIFFGAFGVPPFSHADDPVRAVKAAKDIYVGLIELGYKSAIGICTGNVFAGVVGSMFRREYTVIGDTINMSARLMAAASSLSLPILVDQETFELCRLRMEFVAVNPVLVKGRAEPIPVFSVVVHNHTTKQAQQNNSKRRGSSGGNDHAIVGREREKTMLRMALAQLPRRESFSAATAQPVQALILEGGRGVGKSALANFLIEASTQKGVRVWASACDASHKLTPLYAWREIVFHLLGLPNLQARTNAAQVALSLDALRADIDSGWLKYIGLLHSMTGLPFTQLELEAINDMDSSEQLQYTRKFVHQLVLSHSTRAPLVIIIEDIQWIDSSSLALLISLLRVLKNTYVLLTTSELPEQQRSERYKPLFQLAHLTNYYLDPLNHTEAIRLAGILVCAHTHTHTHTQRDTHNEIHTTRHTTHRKAEF
jgi:class 3 adenylate cyclase/ABC-type transporter Mla MlaB component